jgi:indolepyruvate ferredoxin oxidoreductase beta subunit
MPNNAASVTNIVIAGLGGQGVLTASDIVADVAFHAGLEVKKSEVHGMSQRGGSVASDIRYGTKVFSPMVARGEADYLVVTSSDQVPVNEAVLAPKGVIIEESQVDVNKLATKKAINVALLGLLSKHLPFTEEQWIAALERNFPEKLHEGNRAAFSLGRNGGR